MSFETITIERRQPIIDKRFVKIPGRENGGSPPITLQEAEIGIDSPTDGDDNRIDVLSFGGAREYRTIHPYYNHNLNMDFITYDVIGLNGYRVATGVIDDVQQAIRDVSDSIY